MRGCIVAACVKRQSDSVMLAVVHARILNPPLHSASLVTICGKPCFFTSFSQGWCRLTHELIRHRARRRMSCLSQTLIESAPLSPGQTRMLVIFSMHAPPPPPPSDCDDSEIHVQFPNAALKCRLRTAIFQSELATSPLLRANARVHAST